MLPLSHGLTHRRSNACHDTHADTSDTTRAATLTRHSHTPRHTHHDAHATEAHLATQTGDGADETIALHVAPNAQHV